MENDNFISYLSMGQDNFSCEFDAKHEEQIEVIVDETKLEYLNDYIIENFNEKIKVIKLKEKLGSTLYPKLLILKRNPDIKRETEFKDDTQIKANLLNLEFDNIINKQQFLRDYLDKLSKGFEAKIKDDNGEGVKPTSPEKGFLDPRTWKEEVHIIDLDDYFEGIGYVEVVIEDPKPLTHNVYFAYAKNPSLFPDDLIYRFTNFTEIKEPCSIKFIVDKRVCLQKVEETFKKKAYSILSIGGMYVEEMYMYGNSKDVITQSMIDGANIKKIYPKVFTKLAMKDDDIFMVAEKYYMDPLRGH